MSVDVRQGEFAYILPNKGRAELITGEVWSCVGLVGVHRQSGLIFLAHLDVQMWGTSLEAALREVRARVPSAQEVEWYDVAGLSPWTVSVVVLAVVSLSMLWPNESRSFWIVGLMLATAFGGTRMRTRWLLWRLGFKSPHLLTGRDVKGQRRRWWDARTNVKVSSTAGGDAQLKLSFPTARKPDPRFTVQEDFCHTVRRLMRAGPLTRSPGSD